MSRVMTITPALAEYVMKFGSRESKAQIHCRDETLQMPMGMMQIGAIKLRSDMTDDFLFGIGINVNGSDPGEAVKLLGADPGLEFMARTVGRFDLVATVNFDTLPDFNRLISQLRALPSVAYCEQWLHVKILRERYDHTLEERKGEALEITGDPQTAS